ncbi:unnamed protein product [Pelagomonas calceolata]|uniref:Uncharacterized protein n=1 Tax=Pelagomonas calceolata TaxID=35677 RepID=A0A8J2SJ81_9STRA|nr:unnamed protein product [Pelagomonas calceolata]
MPPPRNASTYNARPPTREREELAKRCLERSKNALLEFQKKSAALGVAVAPMTAPDGTTVAYDHFEGVRVAPPVENAVIKLVEETAPAMPAPKPRLPLSPKNTTTTSSWKTGFLETKKTDARGRFVAPPPAPPRSTVTWKAPPPKSPSADVAALPTPTLVGALEADLGARLGTTPQPEPAARAAPAFSPMPVAPVVEPEPEPVVPAPEAPDAAPVSPAPVVEPEPEPEAEPPAAPAPEAAPPSDAGATKPEAEEEEDLQAFLRRGRRLIAGSASAAAEREALREQAAAAAAERAALSARLAAVEASAAAEPVAAPAPAARTAAELLAEAMATIANDETLASEPKVLRAATKAAKVLTGAPETPPPPAPQPAPAKPAKTPWVPPPARSRSRSPPRPRSPRPRTVPAPPLPVPSSSPPVPRGRTADDTWRRTAAAWRKRLAAIEATHKRLRAGPFPEMRERPFVTS